MNLFRKIFFCLVYLLFAYPIFSQEVSIRGGLNISQISNKMVGDNFFIDSWLKPAFHFGPTFSFILKKNFSLDTGILYSLKGSRNKSKNGFEETYYLEKLNLSYLEMPVNIKIKILERNTSFYCFAGAYGGYALWGNIYKKPDISKDDVFRDKITWEKGSENPMKRLDYGANMGFEVKSNKSSIEINFLLGLAKISYYKSYYNRTLEISYKYQLWTKGSINN
jgi:hypothetical protein